MKIGIDISQLAYSDTGVANYLLQLVQHLLSSDSHNEYVLFFSGWSNDVKKTKLTFKQSVAKYELKTFKIPPTVLDILWNKLHILPVEWLIGEIDIFITSDWTEPPTLRAKKISVIYDLVVYVHPDETDKKIVHTQKSKLNLAKKESIAFLCISEATKKDAQKILRISEEKLFVIYPGM